MMSHHLTMFGGHWSNTIEDMKYLICHVTSLNPQIEGSTIFSRSGISLCYVFILPYLVVNGLMQLQI